MVEDITGGNGIENFREKKSFRFFFFQSKNDFFFLRFCLIRIPEELSQDRKEWIEWLHPNFFFFLHFRRRLRLLLSSFQLMEMKMVHHFPFYPHLILQFIRTTQRKIHQTIFDASETKHHIAIIHHTIAVWMFWCSSPKPLYYPQHYLTFWVTSKQ